MGARTLPTGRARGGLAFPIRFVVLVAPVMLVLGPIEGLWRVLVAPVAHSVAWLSGVAALPATSEPGGVVIFDGGRFAIEVTAGCTASQAIWLFIAAVLAFPVSWRRRAVGVALGVPVLWVANVVRLVVLGAVGVHTPGLFDAFHVYWFQGALLLTIGLGWFAWARWAMGATGTGHKARAKRGSPRRSRSLARAALVFLTTFATLVALALVTPLGDLYRVAVDESGRFVRALLDPASGGPKVAVPPDIFSYHLGGAVALVALIVATPGSALRSHRGRSALGACAVLFGIQVIAHAGIVLAAHQPVTWPKGAAQAFLMNVVAYLAPLGLWFRWLRTVHPRFAKRFTQGGCGAPASVAERQAVPTISMGPAR